ncbi:MAG: YIP1 family protein [Ignavibacteria bacterium]|nr:YIP1 family protein [Ignavibacteria bacterium]
MSEESIQPEIQTPGEFQDNEQLSTSEAMSGVITAPAETFETIANTPRKNYWLIPMLIAVAIGLVSTFLFMQDAELTAATMEKQKAKMREKFSENVKEGKMTQEQADKALESMNPRGMMFKVFGFGGAVIGPFIILLLLSVIYLIALKVMKAQFEFTNVLNVIGLAFLIVAIGNLISMAVSVMKGNITSFGPALFMNPETSGEKMYTLFSKTDLFSVWFYTVIAIGLSKIGRISIAKTAPVVFIVWIVYVIASSLAF